MFPLHSCHKRILPPSSSPWFTDLLLVEVGRRGDVSAGAGGGGQAGRVVHHGVPRGSRHLARGHVVIGGRVPALLVLMTCRKWYQSKENLKEGLVTPSF